MNKFYLLLLLNICFSLFSDIEITQKGVASKLIKGDEIFYSGVVKIPSCKNSDIELCMCYNGDLIKVKRNDNLFMIKDSNKSKINFLMTSSENFSVDSQDNTILYFKIGKNHSYRFLKLLKKLKKDTDSTNKFTWEIIETDLAQKENKIIVPLNTLIIPIDPEKVEMIFEEVLTKQNSKVINLPTIVIKGKNFCDIEEQINKCCLAFMNIKPFHAKQSKKEIMQDNLKVCIVN